MQRVREDVGGGRAPLDQLSVVPDPAVAVGHRQRRRGRLDRGSAFGHEFLRSAADCNHGDQNSAILLTCLLIVRRPPPARVLRARLAAARRQIIAFLSQTALSTADLAERFRMSRPAISPTFGAAARRPDCGRAPGRSACCTGCSATLLAALAVSPPRWTVPVSQSARCSSAAALLARCAGCERPPDDRSWSDPLVRSLTREVGEVVEWRASHQARRGR